MACHETSVEDYWEYSICAERSEDVRGGSGTTDYTEIILNCSVVSRLKGLITHSNREIQSKQQQQSSNIPAAAPASDKQQLQPQQQSKKDNNDKNSDNNNNKSSNKKKDDSESKRSPSPSHSEEEPSQGAVGLLNDNIIVIILRNCRSSSRINDVTASLSDRFQRLHHHSVAGCWCCCW